MDPPKVQKLRLPATSAPWALAPLARPGARLHGVLRPSDARSTLLCADGDMCTLPLRTGAAAPLAAELCLWGVLASLYRQRAEAAYAFQGENLWSAPQNQWSHRRALLLPAGRCGARQPLFYASRASRRLCFKEGRYGSRSCGTAESTAGGTSPSDMVPYLRMLVVGDIRARSYTPQASNHSAMRLLIWRDALTPSVARRCDTAEYRVQRSTSRSTPLAIIPLRGGRAA